MQLLMVMWGRCQRLQSSFEQVSGGAGPEQASISGRAGPDQASGGTGGHGPVQASEVSDSAGLEQASDVSVGLEQAL